MRLDSRLQLLSKEAIYVIYVVVVVVVVIPSQTFEYEYDSQCISNGISKTSILLESQRPTLSHMLLLLFNYKAEVLNGGYGKMQNMEKLFRSNIIFDEGCVHRQMTVASLINRGAARPK